MFIDRAEIFVRGGKGGAGCVSFRREKFMPKGGPDGGDGGAGGDVILHADPSVNTLLDFAGRHHWIADNGRPGMGKDMTGRSGEDLVLRIPPGTLVYDRDSGRLLKDLDHPGMQVRIAKGGRGGKGNKHFTSSKYQAPRFAQPGEEPQERWLRLELKLIADVGLVGLPNAGKSTLLSRISAARPKIADYPFTTLEPQLGIVQLQGYRRFVVADIPGLIEGAHEGVGLGDDFLRHIERTRVIAHLVDVHPMEGQPSPAEAYRIIRNELQKYSQKLADKPELIIANKTDLSDTLDAVHALSRELGQEVLPLSGVTGAGLEAVGERLWEIIEEARQAPEEAPQPSKDPFSQIIDIEEDEKAVAPWPPPETGDAELGDAEPGEDFADEASQSGDEQ